MAVTAKLGGSTSGLLLLALPPKEKKHTDHWHDGRHGKLGGSTSGLLLLALPPIEKSTIITGMMAVALGHVGGADILAVVPPAWLP